MKTRFAVFVCFLLAASGALAQTLVFDGLTNTSLGNATLVVTNNQLIVSNIGTNGLDGVSIALPTNFATLEVYMPSLQASNTLPVGAYIEEEVIGTNGLLGTLKVTKMSETNGIVTGDFLPLGSSNFTVLAYSNGVFVAGATNVPYTEVLANYDPAPAILPSVDVEVNGGVTITFTNLQSTTAGDPVGPVLCNKIYFLPEGVPFNGPFTAVDVTASQVPTLVIAGEIISFFTPQGSGSYFTAVTNLNPVGYWPLHETIQPAPFYDAQNIGTLGAAGNAAYYSVTEYQAPGLLGDTNTADTNYAVFVNGSQIVSPYSLALSNEPPFTVELWAQSQATSTEQCAVSCVDAASPRSGWLIYMDATSPGYYQFRAYNKNGTATSIALAAANPVGQGENHYLAVVVTTNVGGVMPNSSGIYPANSITAYFYLDGQLSASQTGTYAMDDGGDGGGFSMGARSDNSFNFTGELDEVAYYTNALSPSTIFNHYAVGTNTSPSPPYYQVVEQSAPLLFYQLDEAAPTGYPAEGSEPLATNYGVNGATDDGYYLPGSVPGGAAGPNVAGFAGIGTNNVAVVFNHIYESYGTGYVDVPTGGNDLNITGPLTMAAWIKAAPNDDRFQTFAGHSDSGYRMDIDTSMDLHFADANSAGDLTGSALNDGQWHFVVGTYDGAHEYLYIDGLQNASQPATGAATGSGDDFTIGVDPQYVTSRMFDGAVTEVALFNYALSGSQVLSLFYAAEVPPIISSLPPSTQVIGNGSSGTISVAAYGTPTLTYQWLKGTSPVSGAEFSGATSNVLTISNASPSDGGSYSLVISNNYGVITSSVDAVSISQVPVIVPMLPATTHVLAGTTLTLTVGEIGSMPFTNAWYFNGVLLTNGGLVSGATNTTLTISNAAPGNVGTYVFWVTNSYGKASSTGSVIVDSSLTFDENALGWYVTNNGVDAGQGAVSNNVITLTDGKDGEITSFFYTTPLWIHAFKASFTYQDVGSTGGANATADGFTFCIQNSAAGTNVLQTGGGGSGLGYYQLTNSIALCAELYDNGDDAPGIDIATNGEGSAGVLGSGFDYGPTAPVSIISGDPISFSIYYDGSNYDVTMTDLTTSATYSTNYEVGAIWETNIIDSDTAYIGFTAATGGVSAVQTIANFYFTPIVSLSVVKSGGAVFLAWPTGVGGYTLQKSTNLTTWTSLPGPYAILGAQYMYLVTPLTGSAFYRLYVTP
jgi:hypothetical protein